MSKKLQLGINNGFSNAEYHADKEFLSSSSLKLLLESPKKFYDEKILGLGKPLEGAFLDEGTLTHSLILEPHTVATDFVFFDGMRKQGDEYEAWKARQPKNKIQMSKPQRMRCDLYVEAYKKCKTAVELIKGGLAEHTVCVELQNVKIKVRCDYINIEQGYIVDIKTTGKPADLESFKYTIQDYGYELSAALYLEAIEKHYGKKFDFFFLVLGKKDLVCEVYKLSERTRAQGRKKVYTALELYTLCLQTGVWNDKLEKDAAQLDRAVGTYEILEV